jgi:hypothetical protein
VDFCPLQDVVAAATYVRPQRALDGGGIFIETAIAIEEVLILLSIKQIGISI